MTDRVDVVVLTVIPPELDGLLRALNADPQRRERVEGGSVFVRASVDSVLLGRPLSLVLGCIGEAGNANAAAAVAEALGRYKPTAFVLMGIAAGLREKTRIGEVVLSDRVVAYEPAALVRAPDGRSTTQARPEIDRTPHAMNQLVVFYRPDARRLRERFEAIEGRFPEPVGVDQRAQFSTLVASDVTVRTATIASGEKLLRDPNRFRTLRELHGKVEVGEMEAAGVVDACRRGNVPWLVVRGISDFGDDFKDDRFHTLASRTAAVVLVDFLSHGYDLGAQGSSPRILAAETNPYVYGRPMLNDREFVGRHAQRDEILRAIENRQPVQLLGLPLMGRSSLLRWAARHAPDSRAVVELDPSKAGDPVSMVRAIATVLGRTAEAGKVSDVAAAADLLSRMMPLVLLTDDADSIAKYGTGFERGFFDVLRAHTQSGALAWVSSSHDDLETLFAERGLTSRFLNDSRKVWVGALRPEEVRELTSRCPQLPNTLLGAVGGWARGVQWLGDRRFTRQNEADDETEDAFANDCRSVFRRWWTGLDEGQRTAMKLLVRRPAVSSLQQPTRITARRLCEMGIAEERGGCIGVAGLAWESFVSNV